MKSLDEKETEAIKNVLKTIERHHKEKSRWVTRSSVEAFDNDFVQINAIWGMDGSSFEEIFEIDRRILLKPGLTESLYSPKEKPYRVILWDCRFEKSKKHTISVTAINADEAVTKAAEKLGTDNYELESTFKKITKGGIHEF